MAVKRIQRRTITEQVVEQLVELIKKDYRPGDQLPTEQQLEASLGVSRTPIREALKALCLMNIVQSTAGKGTFICNIEPDFRADPELIRRLTSGNTLRELMEVRGIIETEAAALAARRATSSDLDQMQHDVEELACSIDSGQPIPEDIDFHLTVLRATKNSILIRMSEVITEFYAVHGQPPSQSDVTQHREVFKAIKSRKPNLARQAMRRHLAFNARHLDSPNSANGHRA